MITVRTNNLGREPHFCLDKFLVDYDLYKVDYEIFDEEKRVSVYCRLEGLCANSAVYAYNDNRKHRIFLFAAAKKEDMTRTRMKEALKDADVRITQITPGMEPAREGLYTNRMLNLLLALLPNQDKALSYAHGKLIYGSLDNPYNKGRRAGEELGLYIYFSFDACLTAKTLTFSEASASKKRAKKTMTDVDEATQEKSAYIEPYYLQFDEAGKRVYYSTFKKEESQQVYYNSPSRLRKDNKNRIPFLGFKKDSSLEHLLYFEESQAYRLHLVMQEFQERFGKYLEATPVVYNNVDRLEMSDVEFANEDNLLRELFRSSWINIVCEVDDDEAREKHREVMRKVKAFERKLFEKESFEGCYAYAPGKKQLCIRIVADMDDEKDADTCKHFARKLEWIRQGIPTQDIMKTTDVVSAASDAWDWSDGEENESNGDDTKVSVTVKNVFRQLLVKMHCLQGSLPQYMADCFKGCTITYAERKPSEKTSGEKKPGEKATWYVVQLEVDETGRARYRRVGPAPVETYKDVTVMTLLDEKLNDKEYSLPMMKDGHKPGKLFCIERQGARYAIYDTYEFVFPEVERIHRNLQPHSAVSNSAAVYASIERVLEDCKANEESIRFCRKLAAEYPDSRAHKSFYKKDIKKLFEMNSGDKNLKKRVNKMLKDEYNIKKGPDFRTKKSCEETLGACVDMHYWREADNCWKYCVGPHKEGKFDTIHNKVYIRKLVCEQGNPDPAFMERLIRSLGDGWNRISEFSAHPSIFKFLRERLAMYKIEMRAKEVKS